MFVPITTSHYGKVECTICGTTGYPNGLWQWNCKRGHTDPCPDCGRILPTTKGMATHRRVVHPTTQPEGSS